MFDGCTHTTGGWDSGSKVTAVHITQQWGAEACFQVNTAFQAYGFHQNGETFLNNDADCGLGIVLLLFFQIFFLLCCVLQSLDGTEMRETVQRGKMPFCHGWIQNQGVVVMFVLQRELTMQNAAVETSCWDLYYCSWGHGRFQILLTNIFIYIHMIPESVARTSQLIGFTLSTCIVPRIWC